MSFSRFLIAAAAVVFSLVANAQTFSVKGVAVDSLGAPESFATIKIFSLPDTVRPVAATAAAEDGAFKRNLKKAGKYRLVVLSLGKSPAVRDFSVSAAAPVANLGKVVSGGDNVLGEVVVEATKPLISREIDRIAYDVQADVESKTSSISEMLSKVPFVSVDPDGTIKINGSSGFKIYKNGRPNHAFSNNAKDIFKSMPASMIKKIEVITDPGAREDAEGSGMILNIVTLENTIIKGVLGSASLSYMTTGNFPTPQLWLTTQVDRVTFSVNAGLQCNPSRANRDEHYTDRTFDDSKNSSHESTEQRTGTNRSFFGFEASYEIDTLNLVTAEFNAFVNSSRSRDWYSYEMRDEAGEPIYSYRSYGIMKPDRGHWLGGNLNYQRLTRRKGEKIVVSYMISGNGHRYTKLNTYEDMKDMPVPYTGINTKSNATFIEHTAQIDWTRPLWKGQTLDVGVKYINRRNNSVADQDYIGTQNIIHTDFSHITQVAAAFIDYRYNVGKLGLRAGMRYEFSRLEAKFRDNRQPDFHSNLNDWVPNASASYNIDDASSIKIGYSTFINRPGISYLNPMVNSSPQSISFGNPDLGSVRNQSLNLEYSIFTRKFNLSFNAGYRFAHNAIVDVKGEEDDVLISTYSNGGRNKSFNSGLYMQWQMTRKTSVMLNGGASYNDYANPGLNISAHGWSTNVFGRVSQRLPWEISLIGSISYWQGSKSLYNVFSAHGASKISHNISLQRSFLKESRLSVRLMAQNPFGPGKSTYISHTQNVPYQSVSRSVTSNNRMFVVQVSYRFGKLNAQVRKVRSVSNNDMIGGASR